MVTTRSQPGFKVWKALGLAAVVGAGAGVVLASSQRPPEDFEAEAEALAAKVIPGGEPAPMLAPRKQSVDMMAPDPRSLRGLPPYPGASPRSIMSSRPGADQTMAISWFETQDSVDEVLGFYERAFADAKLLYKSHRYGRRRGYVSWFEHDYSNAEQPVFGKGIMHMVSVSQEGSHTTVLVSATEPQKILENLTPLPAGVRVPPGSRPQVLNLSEFGQQRATILANYSFGRDRLVESLEDLWKADGWKVADRVQTEDGISMVVVLNQRQQTVVVEGRGETSQLFITLEERAQLDEGVSP